MKISAILDRVTGLFRKKQIESELDEEVRTHIEMATQENLRRGMTLEDARHEAFRSFGNIDQMKELHRDERTVIGIEQIWNDVRYGFRGLAKTPVFTIFAVLTLGLGIGTNTTIFSAYNALVWKTLPVTDADNVLRARRWFENGGRGNPQYYFSHQEYALLRGQNSAVFSSLIAASLFVRPEVVLPQNAVATSGASARIGGQLVSANFFEDLGVTPQLGRGFLADEDRAPGGNPVLVLSDAYWKRIFGGDPEVLGQSIKLNDTHFTIVGIAPPEFTGSGFFEAIPDFWTPLSMQLQIDPTGDWLNDPRRQTFQILARVNRSITLAQAQDQTDRLIRQFNSTLPEIESPGPTRGATTSVTLEQARTFGATDDLLAPVAGVMLLVSLILLVACANIANMVLARCAQRRREIGVRLALGCGRARIIRQLLTESFLLAGIGGLAGFLFATWGGQLLSLFLRQFALSDYGASGIQMNFNPDAKVFVFALTLALITGAFFGLSPALQFSRPDLTAAFKSETVSLTGRLSGSRFRSALVALQIAVSMFLLISTGLLARAFWRSQSVDPGFEVRDLFVIQGNLGDFLREAPTVAARQYRLFEMLRDSPELTDVSIGSIPFNRWTPSIVIGEATEGLSTLAGYASESYFDVVGIPILRGRQFTRQEIELGAHIAVISQAGARLFWPGENAIGKHFRLDVNRRGQLEDFEVVGIAGDVRFANLSRVDQSLVYLPASPGAIRGGSPAPIGVLVKNGRNPKVMPVIQRAAAGIDNELASTLSLASVEDRVSRFRLLAQIPAVVGGVLAFLALVLAAAGIYGVMAYLVTQQTREIGIRMSIGATSRDVLKGLILQGLRPVIPGMICGFVCAAGLSVFMQSAMSFPGGMDFLYGVPFYDPLTFLGVSCFVFGLVALASLVPARRALKVDPIVALRHE